MTHEICTICKDRHCQDIKNIKGKALGRVIKSNSFPADRSTPETSPLPIKNCPILKEHEEKVEEIENATREGGN